jgi:poly(A) polymerase
MTAAATPSSKPPCSRDDALAVLRRLRDAGHVAYFAGGCVRDELMGLDPKDFDVATDAPPQRVRELFTNTQAVGAAFGVILVRHRRSVVEVATFRTDAGYEDGRHPTAVHFTTAEEDAKRRDFTINGLFLDPVENRVIDYVGGQQDIQSRVLRAIGRPDERFAEDHLRLLRAVRFASRFKLTVEPGTAEAIRHHVRHLTRISPERIAEELRLMLTPSTRGDAYILLRQFGLIDVILRFLPERAAARPDETIRPFLALAPPLYCHDISFGLALAALTLEFRLHGSGEYDPLPLLAAAEVKRSVKAVRQALKISNNECEAMAGALSFIQLVAAPASVAAMKRFLAGPSSGDARLLMSALAASGLLRERIEEVLVRLSTLERTDIAPPPLLSGDDLLAQGLQPGPPFKRALEHVYDEQLEGRVTTRERAIELGVRKVREFEIQHRPADTGPH